MSGRRSSELCHCDVASLRVASDLDQIGRRIARMGVVRNTHRILMGTLGRMRPVGIPRRNLGDNIKMLLRHTLEFGVVYWIRLAQDRDK